jgi:hypothetical protein
MKFKKTENRNINSKYGSETTKNLQLGMPSVTAASINDSNEING